MLSVVLICTSMHLGYKLVKPAERDNDQAQRPPLASRVGRERRVRIAAPQRAEKHCGGSLERLVRCGYHLPDRSALFTHYG